MPSGTLSACGIFRAGWSSRSSSAWWRRRSSDWCSPWALWPAALLETERFGRCERCRPPGGIDAEDDPDEDGHTERDDHGRGQDDGLRNAERNLAEGHADHDTDKPTETGQQ